MAPLEPLIDRQPVERSSHIYSRGYDPARRVLSVMFKDGVVFHHHDVPPAKWDEWLAAESAGSWYYRNIRGRFSSLKMTGHCPKCGKLGLVGLTCVECGAAEVVSDPRPGMERELLEARDREIDARAE